MIAFPNKKYDLIYADPPWPHYGSPNKNAAAGKHYKLMSMEELEDLPIHQITHKNTALFLWVTGPRMHLGVRLMASWGFWYRGVAHVWVKCRKDGEIIRGQGIPPTYSKPMTEYVLLGTKQKMGRPFPLYDYKIDQVIFEPRGPHSRKPDIFRKTIENAYPNAHKRIELFARERFEGWDAWGDEL